MKSRILIADDHRMVRHGIRILLEADPSLQVIAEADDGITAVKLAEEHRPDLAIVDVGMPGINGIEATRQILAVTPRTRVIILSMNSNRKSIEETLRAGASAYLLKHNAFEEMTRAIACVLDGRAYLASEITGIVLDEFTRKSALEEPLLTARENEVLQMLSEGKSSKEIGFLCGISGKTVDTHRQSIMKKLGIFSVAELTRYALKEGISTL